MDPRQVHNRAPYELLDLDGMRSRRSLKDAFEVLRIHAGICHPGKGHFGISPLPLPSGHMVCLVSAHFPDDGIVYVVPLPSCTHFRARRAGASKPDKFPIELLSDATIEPPGAVRLAEGTSLCAVEIIPAALPFKPTNQQWKIIHGVMAAFNFKEAYRSLREATRNDKVADLHFLDCGQLHDLPLPKLNKICHQLTRYDRSFAKIPDQTIANALRTFGIRVAGGHSRKPKYESCHN